MILPLGGNTGSRASLGDVITASVKEANPDGAVKKKQVVKAVIVRTRKEVRRKDGTYIRFDQNAAVLIKPDGEPVGHARFWSGRARVARARIYEDRQPRTRSDLLEARAARGSYVNED